MVGLNLQELRIFVGCFSVEGLEFVNCEKHWEAAPYLFNNTYQNAEKWRLDVQRSTYSFCASRDLITESRIAGD